MPPARARASLTVVHGYDGGDGEADGYDDDYYGDYDDGNDVDDDDGHDDNNGDDGDGDDDVCGCQDVDTMFLVTMLTMIAMEIAVVTMAALDRITTTPTMNDNMIVLLITIKFSLC